MPLPRVLVIGPNVFNSRVGAGVTLSGLFGGWPADRLAQIHTDPTPPDPEVCHHYYRLNDREHIYKSLVSRQIARVSHYAAGQSEEGPLFFGRLTSRLRPWLDGFRPEVVFSQLGGLPMTIITQKIVRRYRIPLAVHISDDWVGGWPENVLGRGLPPLTTLANWEMRRQFARSVRMASVRMSICDSMSREYRGRYGLDFVPFYNAVDPERWPERLPDTPHPERPVRLVYSGSVFQYAQFESLCNLRDAVISLNQTGVRAQLDIYTQHFQEPAHREAFEREPHVRLHDLVPRADLVANLQRADILVLPINFDQRSIDFIRFSIPGKLAEYLMSGTPLLVYGPPNVAQTELAQEKGCAYVVTERNPVALVDAIRRLASDRDLRLRLSHQGRALALQSFSLPAQQERFRELICAMVAEGRRKER